jgi:uncharacterized protein YbjT (DUF2867 family)
VGEINPFGIMKVALVAGATGLIGEQLLQLLIEDPYYGKVIAVTRKPLDIQHPKLETITLNFDKLSEHYSLLKADDVFCCLGTTIRIAKTKEAFRKVDFDYPIELARLTKIQGTSQFLLVSALGADKNSSVFYNQVKGEVEEAIQKIAFSSFHVFRPSLLLGPRTEHRTGEDAAKVFFKFLGFLVPAKYKAIQSIKVVRAMLHFAKANNTGFHILESDELQKF